MNPDRRAAGMAKMQEVYGFSVDPDAVEGDFVRYTVDHLFGDIWDRPALGVPARRLLTIGVLASLGRPDLLEIQFSSALRLGELDAAEVREIVVHLAHYVGWPNATAVNQAAEAAIRKAPAAAAPGAGGPGSPGAARPGSPGAARPEPGSPGEGSR
jgi:4-carboxymuconolactone decarboxylase